MRVHFEHTDTFAGEANYCWVRRETREMPDNATDRQIVIAAKRFAGFTGMRCRVDNCGDGMQITPIGRHRLLQTVFVTFNWE